MRASLSLSAHPTRTMEANQAARAQGRRAPEPTDGAGLRAC